MEIKSKTIEGIAIIEVIGEIDGKNAPELRGQVEALIQPGIKILLDMTQVPYMSSAGLRVLLATYRQVSGSSGQVALVGVSADIQDTMSMTGFLRFFTLYETVGDGVAALQ